ncbi:retrovirus-related pol polyprotein from transposon TNT 1-94 [Tanacetum coccineum]
MAVVGGVSGGDGASPSSKVILLPYQEHSSREKPGLGISQNFSSPYTPEQNCVAERKNITLIKAARMLNSLDTLLFLKPSESLRFTNTLVDEIRIDDSSRYPPDEFLNEDDPSRQYQVVYGVLLEMSDLNVSGLVILSISFKNDNTSGKHP